MMGTDTFFMDRDLDHRSLFLSDPDPPFVTRSLFTYPIQMPIRIGSPINDRDPAHH